MSIEAIDLEARTVNGHEIPELLLVPEIIMRTVQAGLERDRKAVLLTGQPSVVARVIGAELDLVAAPLPDDQCWADLLEDATFMPRLRTVANCFGFSVTQSLHDQTVSLL